MRVQVFVNAAPGVLWTLFFIYTWFVHAFFDGVAGRWDGSLGCGRDGWARRFFLDSIFYNREHHRQHFPHV